MDAAAARRISFPGSQHHLGVVDSGGEGSVGDGLSPFRRGGGSRVPRSCWRGGGGSNFVGFCFLGFVLVTVVSAPAPSGSRWKMYRSQLQGSVVFNAGQVVVGRQFGWSLSAMADTDGRAGIGRSTGDHPGRRSPKNRAPPLEGGLLHRSTKRQGRDDAPPDSGLWLLVPIFVRSFGDDVDGRWQGSAQKIPWASL
ncbi:hypothetical protein ACQ4PT_028989 [Festuca glaucescens]